MPATAWLVFSLRTGSYWKKKNNKMFLYVLSSSYHITKLQTSGKNITTRARLKFQILSLSKSKVQAFFIFIYFFYFILLYYYYYFFFLMLMFFHVFPHTALYKTRPRNVGNCARVRRYCVVQTSGDIFGYMTSHKNPLLATRHSSASAQV